MPVVGIQKVIHQRNKSSPALSTIANAGGLKAAAKRTAFGDVSNTANTLRPSKDDLSIGHKGVRERVDKLAPLQQEKKTNGLLRPAQRPLTVSGLKGLLSSVTQPTIPEAVPAKQSLAEVKKPVATVNSVAITRKVLNKRSTAAFKDQGPIIDEQSQHGSQQLPSTNLQAPVHNDPAIEPQQHIHLDEPAIKLRKTKSKTTVVSEPKKDNAEPLESKEASTQVATERSDGVFIDENGHIQLYQFSDEVEAPQEPPHLDNGVSLPTITESQSIENASQQFLEEYGPHIQPPSHNKQELPAVSEPEEYWDDEDEDYNYDEEGYVTARSYRSRGENTTSGSNTVL